MYHSRENKKMNDKNRSQQIENTQVLFYFMFYWDEVAQKQQQHPNDRNKKHFK